MKYHILHEVPGRMRVRCRNLRLDPEARIELRRWVAEHSELVSASLSARTGNLLVMYSRDATRESILLVLNDLQLFGSATIEEGNTASNLTLGETAANACAKEASKVFIKSLLPKPLQKIKTGWTIASSLFAIARNLNDREVTAFLYGVGKFALMGLFGASIPLRLMLVAGFAVCERLFPALVPPEAQRSLPEPTPVQFEIAQAAI